MKVGDKVIHIERTKYDGDFEWDAEVTRVEDAYIEVKWRRNAVTHPQWHKFIHAYRLQWTNHYGLQNLKQIK